MPTSQINYCCMSLKPRVQLLSYVRSPFFHSYTPFGHGQDQILRKGECGYQPALLCDRCNISLCKIWIFQGFFSSFLSSVIAEDWIWAFFFFNLGLLPCRWLASPSRVCEKVAIIGCGHGGKFPVFAAWCICYYFKILLNRILCLAF